MSTRLVLIALSIAAACGGESSAIDSRTTCSSDQQCTAPTPACDTQAMSCVQCTELNAAQCTGATPNCGADHNCKGSCAADNDCLSGACLGDGSCADANRVLWVARDVTGTTCTPMDKCTLQAALALVSSTKDIIHLDPLGYTFANGFQLAAKMTIVGRGATIAATAPPVFAVMTNGDATIDGLTITDSAGDGIDCTNARVALRSAAIVKSKVVGINASGCTVRVERSTFTGNLAGALLLGGGGTFNVTNNFVFRNGSVNDATVGGIQVLGSAGANSSLEFNTIVDNVATGAGGGTGGIACNTTFAAPNNIIARNLLGAAAGAQTSGTCTYPSSIVQNDIAGLAFASPDVAPFSYKLGAGSTAIDKATTASTVAIDNDGDARPQGAQKDDGADERTP